MIDGVMIRLFAAVWNATVAMAWLTATIRITTTLVARDSAIRQNPGVPNGRGLSHVRMPAQNTSPAASRDSAVIQ